MATGGMNGLGPGDEDLMINALQRQGNYVVLTQEEYHDMRRSMSPVRSSSRIEMSRGRGALLRQALEGNINRPNVNLQDSVNSSSAAVRIREIPKLPIFSGDDVKNEATFDVWRFELKCLLNDKDIDDSSVLNAVRRSLRGTARQMLIPLGENASCRDILQKLDTLFGNVSSSETVLQKFYTEFQKDNESVTSYGCRLENLLQIAIDSGNITSSSRNDMLRSKFWTGLKDDRLKSQTRHKFDTIVDFNQLFKEIRAVEQELAATKAKKSHVQPVVSDTVSASKMDKMSEQMEQLLARLKDLERKVDSKDRREDYNPNPSPNPSPKPSPHTTPTHQWNYDNGNQGYPDRSDPRSGRGNYGYRGKHGGAAGRGNPAGHGRGRGQYKNQPKD